jgi:hypothetical protein
VDRCRVDDAMTRVRMIIHQWVLLFGLVECTPKPPGADASTSGATSASSTGAISMSVDGSSTQVPNSTSVDVDSSPPTTGISSSDSGTFMEFDLPQMQPVECDPHADKPCPDGQKCSAAAPEWELYWPYSGTLSCFPILGNQQKGEACDRGENIVDGLDDCASGLICADIHWAWKKSGVCVDFCDPAFKDGVTNQACSDPRDFCSAPVCQDCLLSVCVPACDPLVQDCPEGTACVLAYVNSDLAFACESVEIDLPKAGESCFGKECGPGAQCVPNDKVGNPSCEGLDFCCTPLCDLNEPNTCPGMAMGEVCKPFFSEALDPVLDPWSVQYNKLGICTAA